MARMIPSSPDESTVSSAERLLFDRFLNDPNTKDWTVIHSLGLSRRGHKPYGEIDFIVLIPAVGVFCLEVKGGRVACHDGVWTTTNREGKTMEMKRSPFMQVREGMFAVRTAVAKNFDASHSAVTTMFGCAVIFPDIQFAMKSPEWEACEVIDQQTLEQPISVSLNRLAQEQRKKVGLSRHSTEPSHTTIRELRQFLRPDFEAILTLSTQLHEAEEHILKLTEEQYDALDLLGDNERCLFEGAAGTGKTMLALEYARRSARAGNRTLLICYNKLLGDWFRARIMSSFTGNLLQGGRYYQFLRETIIRSTYVAEFLQKEQNHSGDELFHIIYPFYGQLAMEELDNQFDVIALDEAQDLLKQDILDLVNLWVKGGLARGKWAIFGDFHRQAIFENHAGDKLKMLLSGYCSDFAKGHLRINCRNTRHIGEETALLSGFKSPPYRMGQVEGPAVDYHYYRSNEEQGAALTVILKKLLLNGVKSHEIVILSRLRFDNSCASKMVRETDFRLLEIEAHEPGRSRLPVISFVTIHAFKGLESPVIVLCDVDQIDDAEAQSLLYVGMSRARSLLIVLLHEQTKQSIKAAVARKLEEGWEQSS